MIGLEGEAFRRTERGPVVDPAWLALLQGDGVTATRLFERRARRTPDDVWALRGVGLSFAEREVEVQATIWLRRAAAREPDHADTWYWIGQFAPRDGHAQLALEALRLATECAPDVADFWAARAGREPGHAALNAIETATRIDPDHAEAWRTAAWIHERAGRRKEALDALQRLSLARPTPTVLRRVARALHALGRHDEGSAAAHDAVHLEDNPRTDLLGPARGTGLGLVGRLLLERGQIDELTDGMLNSGTASPRHLDLWWGIAAALHEEGRCEKALVVLERLADGEVGSGDLARIGRDRAVVLEALGRDDEAETAWEIARMHRDFFRFERAGVDALDVTPDGGGRVLRWHTAPVRIDDPWTRRVRPFSRASRGGRPL